MLSWKIGEVTITRIVELEFPVPYNPKSPFIRYTAPEALKAVEWLKPFITPDGLLILSVHALVVEAPGLKLIVDTCIGNDKPRDMTMHVPLQTTFLKHLEDAGSPREKIDYVVCTHLHVDHVGWNTMLVDGKWVPTFPNARYLIGRKEYDHWKDYAENEELLQVMADSVKPIFQSGLADTVEMDHRISPEIRLMPTPGHTPGHVSVVIESKGETAIITGDMIHHPIQMAHPNWATPYDSDRLAAEATRRAMLKDWSEKPVLVIGTHFAAPTAGHIERDGEAFKFSV
ncbi:MAG TPA: MBL fold metallo-hydrolase [Rhizomicrobium sp.]|jgi:glyoxylase-like metal-dependent hydrolase (beta-lactamase superfamily II)